MTFQLDIKTMIFFIGLGHILIALFGAFYFLPKKQKEFHIKIFLLSKVFQFFAWGMFFFRTAMSKDASILLGNSLLFFGFAAEIFAIVNIHKEKSKKHQLLYGIFTFFLCLIFIFLSKQSYSIRIFTGSMIGISLSFYCIYHLFQVQHKTPLIHLIIYSYLAFLLANIGRSIDALLSQKMTLFSPNIAQLLVFLFIYFILLLASIGYLLLLREMRDKEILCINEKLSKNIRAKNLLLSIISHDIRSPIASLITYLEVFAESPEEISKNVVNDLNKNLSNTLNLLDNLMILSKKEFHTLALDRKKENFSQIVQKIIEFSSLKTQEKDLKINVSQKEEIYAFCHKASVETILRNLLSNAIKFSNPGDDINIRLSLEGDELSVSIQDNGLGISQVNMEHLFEFRLNKSTYGTQREKGSGIGLVLVKELLELNSGRVEVQSEEGKGSTFTVFLSKVLV